MTDACLLMAYKWPTFDEANKEKNDGSMDGTKKPIDDGIFHMTL